MEQVIKYSLPVVVLFIVEIINLHLAPTSNDAVFWIVFVGTPLVVLLYYVLVVRWDEHNKRDTH